MAIKIGGITVIDDSRNLCNAANVNATSICATNFYGSGAGLTGLATAGGGELVCGTTRYTLTSSNQRSVSICLTSTPSSGDITLPNATTLSKGSPTFTIKNVNCATSMVIRDANSCILAVAPACSTVQLSLYDNSFCQGRWQVGSFTSQAQIVDVTCASYGNPFSCYCYYVDENCNWHGIFFNPNCCCICYRAVKKSASGFTVNSNTFTIPATYSTIPFTIYCACCKGGWILIQGSSCHTGGGTLGCNAVYYIVTNCDGTYSSAPFYDCTKQCCYVALGCNSSCGEWWSGYNGICHFLNKWVVNYDTIMNNTTDTWFSTRIHCYNNQTTGVPTICQALYRGGAYPSGSCRLCSASFGWQSLCYDEGYFFNRTYGYTQDGTNRVADYFCFCNNGNVCYYCLCGANAAALSTFTDYMITYITCAHRIGCGVNARPLVTITKFNPGQDGFQNQMAFSANICGTTALSGCLFCPTGLCFTHSGQEGNRGNAVFYRVSCGLFAISDCDCVTQSYKTGFSWLATVCPLTFCPTGTCCTYAYYDMVNQNCWRAFNCGCKIPGDYNQQVCDMDCGFTIAPFAFKQYHLVCNSSCCTIYWSRGCVIGDTCWHLVRMGHCTVAGASALNCVCRWIICTSPHVPGATSCSSFYCMGTADCLCLYTLSGIRYRFCVSGGGTWATNCCISYDCCLCCNYGCTSSCPINACYTFCACGGVKGVTFGCNTNCAVHYYDFATWPAVMAIAGCIDNKTRYSIASYDKETCRFMSVYNCCSASGALDTEVAVGSWDPSTCSLSYQKGVLISSLSFNWDTLIPCTYSILYSCSNASLLFTRTLGKVTLL